LTNSTFNLNFKINKGLVYALISLNLYIATTVFEAEFSIPNIVKYIFSLFALFHIFRFYSKSKKNPNDGPLVEGIRLIFTIVSIFLLITSVRFEKFYLQEVFGEQFFFLPFLTPILFININISILFFKFLMEYSYKLLFLAIVIQVYIILFSLNEIYYVKDAVGVLTFTLLPSVLLSTSYYYKYKYSFILPLIFFIGFAIILAMLGRRGETLENVFMIVWAFIIRLGSKRVSVSKKITFLIFALIFFASATLITISYKSQIYMFERGFDKDGFDESRGETIDNFIADFGSQAGDWIIGRGLNGMVQKFNFGENALSRSIEIGYFNILLKGGLLYLIPMMLLFIIAFIRGFFYSKNDLVKGLSGLIIWQILYMFSFGMANYNTSYTLLWIATAVCLNPIFRAYTNDEVIKKLKPNIN
jgi:hypothetical protein